MLCQHSMQQFRHCRSPRRQAQNVAKRRSPTVTVTATLYTQPSQQAIRHAQHEACRQGSMFLTPPHLLQGLLDTVDCSACSLLQAVGVSSQAAEAVLVDPQMVPSSSSMTAGELHWAPDTRKALQIAATAADAAGQPAAGTPHLLLGLLDCGNAAVKKVLDKAGVQVLQLRSQAEAAARNCNEPEAGNQQPADSQAAQLIQQYKQWVAQHGNTTPSAGGLPIARPPVRTPEDDDIYE